jgi:hypothetical protein
MHLVRISLSHKHLPHSCIYGICHYFKTFVGLPSPLVRHLYSNALFLFLDLIKFSLNLSLPRCHLAILRRLSTTNGYNNLVTGEMISILPRSMTL